MLSASIQSLMKACAQNSTDSLELVSNAVFTSGPPLCPPSPVFPSASTATQLLPRDTPTSLYALANTIKQRHGIPGTPDAPETRDNERIIYSTFTGCKRDPSKFFISRTHTDTGLTDIACLRCDVLDVSPSDDHHDDVDKRDDTSVAACHYIVLDVAFYDDRIVSLLLQESFGNGRPVLIQLPLSLIYGADLFNNAIGLGTTASNEIDLDELPCMDVGPMLEAVNHRVLENMKASLFAVSGTRKVACVLFSSRRRIRLFLFDVEDDESTIHAQQSATTVMADTHQEECRRLELAVLRD